MNDFAWCCIKEDDDSGSFTVIGTCLLIEFISYGNTQPGSAAGDSHHPPMPNSFAKRPSKGVVVFGTIIDTPSPRHLRVRKDHYCIVSPTTGKITHIGPLSSSKDDPIRILSRDVFREYDVIWLQSTQFICPGMIDTHIHAPQYRQLGSANNLPLVFSYP
jgi:hypothetical protein